MKLSPINIRSRDIIFLIIAGLLVGLYVVLAGGGFPLDDSWIHQTYARNLAQNGEWAFIPGEPSAASTSPLYTVVLAIGYMLGIPYALWAHLLGVLALGVMAILFSRMVEWGKALEKLKNYFGKNRMESYGLPADLVERLRHFEWGNGLFVP